MTDHPALFQTPMVLGIIEERKDQTRREKHLQRFKRFGRIREFGPSTTAGYDWHFRDKEGRWQDFRHADMLKLLPWHVGDRLWVRETLRRSTDDPDLFAYQAGGALVDCGGMNYPTLVEGGRDYVPSIHMRRFASRLTLTVTDVRIERLQDISEKDAVAEGIERLKTGRGYYDPTVSRAESRAACRFGGWYLKARDAYAALWDHINGVGAWDRNPWVPAYTFTVERRNIDAGA